MVRASVQPHPPDDLLLCQDHLRRQQEGECSRKMKSKDNGAGSSNRSRRYDPSCKKAEMLFKDNDDSDQMYVCVSGICQNNKVRQFILAYYMY